MGAVAYAIRHHSVSHPRSSKRTCGATASGSPTGFTASHTTVHLVAGVRGAGVPVPRRRLHRRTVLSRPRHLVPSGEEVADALVDISVDAPENRSTCSVGEVVRPAAQRPVQRVARFPPRIVIAGHQ